MSQPDYDTDPGLVWSPRVREPRHAASVESMIGAVLPYVATCPACAFRKAFAYHDDAMVATLNHRNEFG